jgi:hypothetical protein
LFELESSPEIAGPDRAPPAVYTYARRVADRAALGPLYGYYVGTPPSVSQLNALASDWHRRVKELAAAGWPVASSEATVRRMLGCLPSGAANEPRWRCHVPAACPICHGTEAATQWSNVDAFLFPPGGGRVCSLFTRERVMAVGLGRGRLSAVLKNWLGVRRDGGAAKRGFVSRDMDHRALAAKHVTGGLSSVVVSLRSSKGAPASWRVKARQLLVVEPPDPAFDKDETLVRKSFTVDSARVAPVPPNRVALAEAVAWVLAYPKFLISGPADPALEYLDARQGRRLTTRFGVLYGGHA